MNLAPDAASRRRAAVFFVASPLQYMAARQVARQYEADSRHVLVWYHRGVESVVQMAEWDAAAFMPWPRRFPLPGPFGRHRRLRANIRLVAELVGECEELVLHSAVFDTEAVNYFLHALPRAAGARRYTARILPDGLISVRRYPLSIVKRWLQRVRRVRGLFAPELRYTAFSGDRIGSDAPFCDRIYVLPGLPHEYPPAKVVELAPLAAASDGSDDLASAALIIGQPLVGFALMSAANMAAVTAEIHAWLASRGITRVLYKGHPKDRQNELSAASDEIVCLDEPLEVWMGRHRFAAVVGVRSTALLFARQTQPLDTPVVAFGWTRLRFKSNDEQRDMLQAFQACGVDIHDAGA